MQFRTGNCPLFGPWLAKYYQKPTTKCPMCGEGEGDTLHWTSCKLLRLNLTKSKELFCEENIQKLEKALPRIALHPNPLVAHMVARDRLGYLRDTNVESMRLNFTDLSHKGAVNAS